MPKDNVQRLKVLFLCTGNSCRRQMAEAWARHLKVDTIEPYSAGIETHGLHPKAVRVMAEVGVDISGQRSTLVDNVMDVDFDYVVSVCGHANETCPMWLSTLVHKFANVFFMQLDREQAAAVRWM